MTGEQIATALRKTLRAKMAESVGSSRNTAWAERIMARHARGEVLPVKVVEIARTALRLDSPRTPGEDDE